MVWIYHILRPVPRPRIKRDQNLPPHSPQSEKGERALEDDTDEEKELGSSDKVYQFLVLLRGWRMSLV